MRHWSYTTPSARERARSDSCRKKSIHRPEPFSGTTPKAFSHTGVISSGVNLGRLLKQVGGAK